MALVRKEQMGVVIEKVSIEKWDDAVLRVFRHRSSTDKILATFLQAYNGDITHEIVRKVLKILQETFGDDLYGLMPIHYRSKTGPKESKFHEHVKMLEEIAEESDRNMHALVFFFALWIFPNTFAKEIKDSWVDPARQRGFEIWYEQYINTACPKFLRGTEDFDWVTCVRSLRAGYIDCTSYPIPYR